MVVIMSIQNQILIVMSEMILICAGLVILAEALMFR